jgi:acetyl esterase/lipase
VGFSVGGHLALSTATSFEQRTYSRIDAVDDVSCRPDFAILCYPGFLQANPSPGSNEIWPGLRIAALTPPVLLTHASDDTDASSENSAVMYLALRRNFIPTELHIYGSGEHDFGVRQNGNLPSTWTQLSVFWLRSLNLLTSP